MFGAETLVPESQRDRLRELINSIDVQMAGRWRVVNVPDLGSGGSDVHSQWEELVSLLELEALPEQRNCPGCGRPGLLAATRCGYCWIKLSPPAPLPPAERASA